MFYLGHKILFEAPVESGLPLEKITIIDNHHTFIKMFFLHTFTMRSASFIWELFFLPAIFFWFCSSFQLLTFICTELWSSFESSRFFGRSGMLKRERGETSVKIFWINIFNMFGSAVADFERFVFFAERHLINHSGLCRILVTPKMSVQSIQVEFITNLSAVCHKFINLNSTTMCWWKITKRTTSVNYWNLFVTERPCTRNTFFAC